MAVASFSLAPDAAVDLAWKLGLSLRWLTQDTNGGSSGMSMLGNALRDGRDAARPKRSSSSAATPPASPATPRSRRTSTPRRRSISRRSATAGRTASMRWWRAARSRSTDWRNPTTATSPSRSEQWAAKNPYAVYRTPLTMDGVSRRALGGRSAVALRLRAGGGGRAGDRRGASRPRAEGPAGRARPRPPRELQLRQPGGRRAADRHQHVRRRSCGRRPACGRTISTSPRIYDDYPTMVLAQANDLGLIPGNDLARFCRVTIGEQRFPVNTWGGMLSRRPARRPRRRTERHFGGRAAIAAPRRRAAGEGRAARGHDRLRHDDVPLRRHRGGGDPGARGMSAGVTIWRCANCRTGIFSGAAAVPALSRRQVRR